MPRRVHTRRSSCRKNQRTRRNRKSRCWSRRMRGGVGVSTCPTAEDTATNVNILEDQLKTAGPDTSICYGNSVTSCTTLTVVMQDGWKIGVHTNPSTHVRHLKGQPNVTAQRYNPDTMLSSVKQILQTDTHFVGKKIKHIYLIGDSGEFKVQALYKNSNNSNSISGVITYPGAKQTINNVNSSTIRVINAESMGNAGTLYLQTLSEGNALEFFKGQFGTSVDDTTSFVINPTKTIQNGAHFIVKGDGTLDISA